MDMQGLGGGEGVAVVGEPGVEGAAERAAAFVDRIDSQQRLAQLFGQQGPQPLGGRLHVAGGKPRQLVPTRVLREQARAAAQLHRCVGLDPGYSAAWKLLGKAQHEIGDIAAARHAWENGVLAARRNGDVQAEKEMNVFLRRLARTSTP